MKSKFVTFLCLLLCAVLCVCGFAVIYGDLSLPLGGSSPSTPSVTSSTASSAVSDTASSVVSDTSSDTAIKDIMEIVKVGPYEIIDPYGTRNISNEKTAHYFGVAKDGKPHSASVNFQKLFDSKPQYKALTLDTRSQDKRMYLTFDCGYEYQNLTSDIMDTLKEKNVKVVFFCTLSYMRSNPDAVKRMLEEGHIVANHSATHPDFTKLSRVEMAEEIYKVEKHLKDNYNYTAKFFRFPEGSYSDNTLDVVSSMGYRSVFWSIAHGDYDENNQPSVEKTYETITSRYHPGAVILLHASSTSNSQALAQLIDKAHADGYTFKTLDEYPW
ncbi:MAG: hypothetical protein E7525_04590 [Ruminococcaceae bacterium]|nr:hypothetical protein [Oscillospiraceae bacterium]